MTLRADDIDSLMGVMAAAFDPMFGEAWTRRQVEDALIIGNCSYVLMDIAGRTPERDNPAAGFFLSRAGFEEEELLLLAVDPACRRQGLGRNLLNRLMHDARGRGAKRLLLEMRRGNPASSLYQECGFCSIGVRPNYYRTRVGKSIDAITFALDLN